MQQEPHAGAPVVHGSEQSGDTANLNAAQQPSPEEMELLFENLKADPDTIRRLRFYESESKVALRERLQRAMLASADRAVKARSERARERFWRINLDANACVLCNASEADLGEIVDLLRSEFSVAEAWERLEGGTL